MRVLTNLRIDEVSAVIKGANPGAQVLIRKVDKPLFGFGRPAPMAKMFKDIIKADELRGPRDEDDSAKVEQKLRAWAKLMVVVDPSRSEEEHMLHMTSTARGRSLALHLNEISKQQKDTPMLDIRKMIPIMEEGLMAQATINKRDGETDAAAIARKYETDIEYRKSWATVTEAKQRLALSMPNLISTSVTSVEVGNTNVRDDSAEAVRLLQQMAEKQHRSFEEVFLDSSNAELANRTYRPQHRPTTSSVPYDAEFNS